MSQTYRPEYRQSVLQAEKRVEDALRDFPEPNRFEEDWYAEARISAEKKFEAAVQNRLELCEGTLTTKVCEWARFELAAVRAEMQAVKIIHQCVTGNSTRPDGYGGEHQDETGLSREGGARMAANNCFAQLNEDEQLAAQSLGHFHSNRNLLLEYLAKGRYPQKMATTSVDIKTTPADLSGFDPSKLFGGVAVNKPRRK